MSLYNFEGRVAVVTGAGRGIGRAYALLLAERGAHVVVNDLGGSIEGDGNDSEPATSVAKEIVENGGSAIANANNIASAKDAERLVASAVDTFGRIDILINNAGIMRWAAMPNIEPADLAAHLDVHVCGTFNTVRAAWPHMQQQQYGRIINTTSAGMLGLPNNLAYATAKGATVGLTRSLATAGRKYNILANLIAPAAVTRMAGPAGETDPTGTPMDPAMVAPLVAYLAHETCPVTGEMYAAGAGRFSRMFIALTEGYLHTPENSHGMESRPTIETVANQWAAINDDTRHTIPTDLISWSKTFTSHLNSNDLD